MMGIVSPYGLRKSPSGNNFQTKYLRIREGPHNYNIVLTVYLHQKFLQIISNRITHLEGSSSA